MIKGSQNFQVIFFTFWIQNGLVCIWKEFRTLMHKENSMKPKHKWISFFWLKFIKTYFLKKFNEFLDKQTFFCWITTCTLKNPAYAYCQNQIWQLFHCIFVKLNLFCKKQWAKTQKKNGNFGSKCFRKLFNIRRVAEPEDNPQWRHFKYSFDFCLRGNQVSSRTLISNHTIFRSFSSMCTAKLQKR